MKKRAANEIFFNNLEINLHDLNYQNPWPYGNLVKLLIKENSFTSTTIPPLLNSDGSLMYTDEQKANSLNDFLLVYQQ